MSTPEEEDSGPVWKEANIAAAQTLRAEKEAREKEAAAVKVTAALVGETALALARQQRQHHQQSSGKTRSISWGRSSPLRPTQPNTRHEHQQQQQRLPQAQGARKMSVAARARAAADLPTATIQPLHHDTTNACYDSPRGDNTGDNAGVSRGKFSPQQMKQLVDRWGKEDTSDDDDDHPGKGAYDRNKHELYSVRSHDSHSPGKKQYLQSLQRSQHHLHDASLSPQSSASPSSSSAVLTAENFHYQHHRVSSYSTSKRSNKESAIKRGYGSSNSLGTSDRSNNSDVDDDEDSGGGGIFASAKNWLQSQREKLARLELERQVEDQRRKLVEEGRRQRALEAEKRRRNATQSGGEEQSDNKKNNSSGADNSNTIRHEHSYEDNEAVVISGITSLCGMGSSLDDDGSEYEGVVRVDSSGQIIDMALSGSFDDEVGDYLKVSTPKKTVSGKGMSVKVDLPDDDVDDNTDNINTEASNDDKDDCSVCIAEIKLVSEPPQGETSYTPPILTKTQMKSLIESGGLPPSLNYCKWKRLYSLARDGDSFETFLRLVEGHDRTVLVVKSTLNELFGGYADTRWEARGMHRQANEFYGSAQACLFRFVQDDVTIYKWSGANRYIQLCDAAKRTVAFGGGGDEGVFGLCVEEDFRRGTTGHCSTFENEQLCEDGYFDVVDVEVWGFTLDF